MNTITIIGAGASGLMAAIYAKTKNNKVIILEQNDKPGKKLLVTGNGKCNLGNRNMDLSCFCGPEQTQIQAVLGAFGVKDTENFFQSLGLLLKDRNGYLYPFSGQASTVVTVLVETCKHLGVEIHYGVRVNQLTKNGDKFMITTNQKKYTSDLVIVATGSKAAPKTGSTGAGYELLSQLGLTYEAPLPALMPLISSSKYCKALAGIRTDAQLSLYVDRRFQAKEAGELQLTDYGVSGIPVFQFSHIAAQALREGKEVCVYANFLPMFGKKQLLSKMASLKRNLGKRDAFTILSGLVNYKLAKVLLQAAGIKEQRQFGTLTEMECDRLCATIVNFPFMITDTCGFDKAQTCSGGFYLSQFQEDTMEAIAVPGLYVTGELLNVNGKCGGYNLQWAWSTGYVAGKAAAERCK
jgi:hypothetical protein